MIKSAKKIIRLKSVQSENARLAHLFSSIKKPIKEVQLQAKRNLRGNWNLYAVTDRPNLPIAHVPALIIRPLFRAPYVDSYKSVHTGKGRPELIARNISLKEVFRAMAEHEVLSTAEVNGTYPSSFRNRSGSKNVSIKLSAEIDSSYKEDKKYFRNHPDFGCV